MTRKERSLKAVEALEKLYPDAVCSLTYAHSYELLIAPRLSPQCTDARVNIVTKELFSKYPTLTSLAEASVEDIEAIVKPCGLFHTKARDIVNLSRMLLSDYGGGLPDTMGELTRLPGVGRKTANLVLGDIFGKPAVVTDTHCIRICGRLGLTKETEPYKVEMDLKKLLPPEKSSDFCHRLVLFGREFCKARSPQCTACPLREFCKAVEPLKK